jgi:flagellar hook-associated protein 2
MSSALNLSNLSTSSSGASSFAGISSGINTTALIQAEISQASLPMEQLQSQQTANNARSTAYGNLESQMTALSSAISDLNTNGLPARVVSSSDSTNGYVTATASGGASGSYSVKVGQLATYAQLSPTLDSTTGDPTNLAVASATAPVFGGSSGTGASTATFAIEGTDGITQQITLTAGQNNIYALADAINAAGVADPNVSGSQALGVTATVVNTGSGTDPYELVLQSDQTGIGTAGANLTIADVTSGGAVNNLGIAAGSVTTDAQGNLTGVTGGTQSNQSAQNAQFTLDGIQITRASNSVSDAVNGVTFNLVQGGQTGTTTLTVNADSNTALTDMQAVVSAYNTLMTTYNTDTAGSGPLAGDGNARALIQQVQSALTGSVAGQTAGATYTNASALGLSTNSDGTLSLDSTQFTNAFQADPTAAQNVFTTSGTSTNGVVSLNYAGTGITAGNFGFNITSYASGGAVSGTFTAPDGSQYTLTGTNGLLVGQTGTPLAGLYLNVTGTGTGTLTISKGVGQATMDAIANMTNPATGTITQLQNDITSANTGLTNQINSQQTMLNNMQTSLQNQYSQMESTLAQLQAASQSIGSMG